MEIDIMLKRFGLKFHNRLSVRILTGSMFGANLLNEIATEKSSIIIYTILNMCSQRDNFKAKTLKSIRKIIRKKRKRKRRKKNVKGGQKREHTRKRNAERMKSAYIEKKREKRKKEREDMEKNSQN